MPRAPLTTSRVQPGSPDHCWLPAGRRNPPKSAAVTGRPSEVAGSGRGGGAVGATVGFFAENQPTTAPSPASTARPDRSTRVATTRTNPTIAGRDIHHDGNGYGARGNRFRGIYEMAGPIDPTAHSACRQGPPTTHAGQCTGNRVRLPGLIGSSEMCWCWFPNPRVRAPSASRRNYNSRSPTCGNANERTPHSSTRRRRHGSVQQSSSPGLNAA